MFQIDSIFGLLLQCFIFFAFNLLFCIKLNKTLIAGSTSFWFAWILLLLGTKSFVGNNLMQDFGEIEYSYVSLFHRAAFIGFIIGSFISYLNYHNNKGKQVDFDSMYVLSKYLTEFVSRKILNIILIIGVIFFLTRLQQISLGSDYFTDAREIYKEREFNFFNWIGTHLTVVIYCLLIFQGVYDSFHKMNLKKLLKVILYCSPLFLANSTRTFLIFPLINYFAGFLLMRSLLTYNFKVIKRSEIFNFSLLLFSMLMIFSIIGFLRGGYGKEFSLYTTIVSWPVSTSYALESWLNAAIISDSTNGLLTFDWFANFIERIGLIDFTSEKDILTNINKGFKRHNNPAPYIPRSIIPDIIFDFGKESLFIVTFIITALSQVITINFAGKGLAKHAFASLVFIAMFMTIQKSIFSPGFVSACFWIIILNWFARSKINEYEIN